MLITFMNGEITPTNANTILDSLFINVFNLFNQTGHSIDVVVDNLPLEYRVDKDNTILSLFKDFDEVGHLTTRLWVNNKYMYYLGYDMKKIERLLSK